MEQEQKSEENKNDLEKESSSLNLSDYVEDILRQIKEVEKKILNFEQVKEYKSSDYINKTIADFKTKINAFSNYCKSLSFQINELAESEEWNELINLSDKLELLGQKIEQFIGLFSGRKQVNQDFLKKIDFIIMNEAIKNEMVSHIFEMLNRGESKDKLMIASLEFVYFLKEIESDETLNELKELKNLLLTTEKEEANIRHFLEKLSEKMDGFSKAVNLPVQKLQELKKTTVEIQSKLSEIVNEIEERNKEIEENLEGK
ncbi:hypothetical protein TTHT_0724 [Thermotomaculum hydrothermale]|uniref:Uncharacterized protein n=1 Tax=Thermotomaculum hydrothermale TaxID=981385 RepID=A0A7R6SYZ3_9BACT|nr:hypothetical protein [Thermotomaculum hydrothermale]BBB32295.1 hypothetical protein TTHT_0724 [Thermotomaculum hydrothermale]